MGCTQSTASRDAAVKSTPPEVAPPAAAPAVSPAKAADGKQQEEKPKPQVFALMRNGHSVIREAQVDIRAAIEKEDYATAKDTWEKLCKWSDIHMIMEEGNDKGVGFFRLLDEHFEGVATENHLSDDHDTLQRMETALNEAFQQSNKITKEIKTAFEEYSQENLTHLEKEEKIMMPKVMALVKMGHSMKKIMIDDLLAAVINTKDFEFFVKFANEILEKHPAGMPRARVFDHALWAVSSPEQWLIYDQWIKETVSDKTYQELQAAINA